MSLCVNVNGKGSGSGAAYLMAPSTAGMGRRRSIRETMHEMEIGEFVPLSSASRHYSLLPTAISTSGERSSIQNSAPLIIPKYTPTPGFRLELLSGRLFTLTYLSNIYLSSSNFYKYIFSRASPGSRVVWVSVSGISVSVFKFKFLLIK